MLRNGPLDATLQRVAELARHAMPEIGEVSVTLVEAKKVHTVVFAGRVAVQLDERQYASRCGPCLDAALAGQTIVVDTAVDDSGYLDFVQATRTV